MSSSIASIVASVTRKKGRIIKSNRTLSLDDTQFNSFQNHCKQHGITSSEVVDRLIEAYLLQVDNDVD